MKKDRSKKLSIDEEKIRKGLEPTALTSERISALVESGIPAAVIATALNTSDSSLRNWSSGASEPRLANRERLDNLRYTMQLLVEGGVLANRAAMWIRSRQPSPPFDRPIEIIGEHPEKVFEYAEVFLDHSDQE